MQPSIIVWDLETVADPGAEVCKSPLNVELLQALEGRSGNWAALRSFEGIRSSDGGLTVDHRQTSSP